MWLLEPVRYPQELLWFLLLQGGNSFQLDKESSEANQYRMKCIMYGNYVLIKTIGRFAAQTVLCFPRPPLPLPSPPRCIHSSPSCFLPLHKHIPNNTFGLTKPSQPGSYSTFVLQETASLTTRYATDHKVIKQQPLPPKL